MLSFITKLKSHLQHLLPADNVHLVMQIFTSWIFTAFFLSCKTSSFLTLQHSSDCSFSGSLLLFLLCFVMLCTITACFQAIHEEHLLLLSILLYGCRVLTGSDNVYFLSGICLFFGFCFCYCYQKSKNCFLLVLPKKASPYLPVAAFILLFTFSLVFLSSITVARYLNSSSSTFDFGIFVQTFYNLKEHFNMQNTCERNQILSHLQVHTSWFYYLLTPFYLLFPHAQTLLILQALAVASGLFPLYLSGRKCGLTKRTNLIICLLYSLSPAVNGGCFYDFHENVFLLPLLLWMFFCFESGYTVRMFLCAILVCSIKEDAAFFIICFAIYLLFARHQLKKSVLLLLLSSGIAGFDFWYLSRYGLGLMTYRYENIMCDTSIFSIFKTLLTNPAYLFTQVFTEEKMPFLLLLFLPVAGLTFASRKYSRLLLLIPLLFINLLPDYVYMHSVFYQYVFGPYAFALYLCILNISDLKGKWKQPLLYLAMAFSLFAFFGQLWPKTGYIKTYLQTADTRNAIQSAFSRLPDSASIASSTFYVPQLANRKTIYMMEDSQTINGEVFPVDYAVFDLRPGYASDDVDSAISVYQANGYKTFQKIDQTLVILKKAAAK